MKVSCKNMEKVPWFISQLNKKDKSTANQFAKSRHYSTEYIENSERN